MKGDVLIGIDAGTSVIKAVAFDTQGRQIAIASRPNSYRTLENGGAEQDMSRTWADSAAVTAALGEQIEGLADRVIALAVTGQGDGTWLIDADGEPVHNGWLWLDARAAAEARELAASDGINTIYQRTGTGINVCQMRTHLKWMQRNAPEMLERAATAMHCKDWLYFCLTGERASDPSEGVFTFGDVRTRDYSDEVLAALGLKMQRSLLPPIVDGAQESHPLASEAARLTGLPEGLPVVLGYVDVACSALGAGLYDPEAAPGLSIIGSTGMHMRFVPNAGSIALNDDQSGYTMAFPGGAFAQMQSNMVATINLDWILDLGCEILDSRSHPCERGDLLTGIDEHVLSARPGAAIFHPYISVAGERGPFTEPDARASFTGLDQSVGWFDLVRAVHDSLALAARDCYAAMGPIPGEIRLTGGAARSSALRRILAASLGSPVRGIEQGEAGAAGAVMIAAVQQGIFPDIAACSYSWVKPLLQEPLPPEPALRKIYNTLFEAYLATREAMPPIWAAQADMRRAMA